MKGLMYLVEQAKALAGESTCERDGHDWQTEGGRRCPTGNENCSQSAYVCARCGETDYGDDEDGPGMTDCQATCGDSMTGWRPGWMDG
jgi:hypothetical protein